jgi:hypothetical protein
MWTQKIIEEYIANQIQENLNLDYKASGAFSRENNVKDKKIEDISKDVSSMANSQGGVIIYGIKEFGGDKRYLPEKIDPIDQTVFSKEWLEQIINSGIHPRIQGIVIHPVQLDTDPKHCVYVVEIPQSNTAHQAKDKRYYKRYNFESVAMEDYEIRDTMNRASVPNVSVKFGLYDGVISEDEQTYASYRGLRVIIKNESAKVVNRFKLLMTLTNMGWYDDDEDADFKFPNLVEIRNKEGEDIKTWTYGNAGSVDYRALYKPDFVLFPQKEIDIGDQLKWGYRSDVMLEVMNEWEQFARDADWEIKWKLFADNMPFKEGTEMVCDLPTMMHH